MKVPFMGIKQELQSFGRCFRYHRGNSHKEKTAFYVLAGSVVLLIFLRAFDLVSFADPRVGSFVDTGVELLKLAAAYFFGSITKGERVQTRLRDLGHDPIKLMAAEAIQERIAQLERDGDA